MKRARFVAAARREFLVEVVYYNKEETGLGARFAAAVEDAPNAWHQTLGVRSQFSLI